MSCKSKINPDLVPNEDPLTFEVVPKIGLKSKDIVFLLGMPLNQVLTMCQQNSRKLKNIQLLYSKKNSFGKDVCVCLSSDGIKLFFDGNSQLLKLIEVDNLLKIRLTYGNKVFSEPLAQTSMDNVSSVFGSTHPGAYDEKENMYVQSWPGLSFCYPTDGSGNEDAFRLEPGFGPNMLSLKYDANCQPRLTKISIYNGKDLNKPEHVNVPHSCYCGQNRTRLVEAIKEGDEIVGLNLKFETQGSEVEDGDLELILLERQVYFGDSVAAVQAALGAPSKVYYKSDDKMKIHRGNETQCNQPHFFFNYFSMGFDILFDFVTKRLIEFVLHTNAPGHPNFGIYSKCEFSIDVDNGACRLETTSKFDEFSSAFCDPTARPVVLQRSEAHPFGQSFCYGTDQIVVEVMENGHIASLILYDKNE